MHAPYMLCSHDTLLHSVPLCIHTFCFSSLIDKYFAKTLDSPFPPLPGVPCKKHNKKVERKATQKGTYSP